jgi:hypothetical protein
MRGLVLGIERGLPLVAPSMEEAASVVADGMTKLALVGAGADAGKAFDGGVGSLMRTSGALMAYIRSASFGGVQGNTLADWMRQMGFDEETIEDYRDLHRLRDGGRWKTREAAALFRRRTILTGGDWTGGGMTEAASCPGG